MDINAQKKEKAQFYASLMQERRTKEEKEKEDHRLELVKKKQKKEEWDDRHWKQKSLAEMLDRDWRIFREDFNITIKGGKVPRPIRFWEEAGLPKEVVDVIFKVGYKADPLLGGGRPPEGGRGRNLQGWVQGTHTDSEASHPDRLAKPGHHRCRRNRFW
uniref:G-patch domain-containing protein n=1 Tax=Steinernema glaseri TaxID=37863 RepID=A0A1I7YIU3_9BILA